MTTTPTPAPASTDDLPEAIRQISRAAERLTAQGLNRKAVVVLLVHHSKLGAKTVETVMDSLGELERKYTTQPKKKA